MHYGPSITCAVNCFDFITHSSVEKSEDLRKRLRIHQDIPIYTQFALINEIVRKSQIVAVTGSYGKTLTTSLITHILEVAGINASFTCGGYDIQFNTNARLGTSNYWVVEAVETHANLLYIYPTFSVVLNIEHENLIPLFTEFVKQTEKFSLINVDDLNCRLLADSLTPCNKLVRFGTSAINTGYAARHINATPTNTAFSLYYNCVHVGDLVANTIKAFSIYNALAAASIAHMLGLSHQCITSALCSYEGVANRFEVLQTHGSTTVVSDIAHHPPAITACITKCKSLFGGLVIVVYRPHMYQELNQHFSETTKALDGADIILVLDVLSFKDAEAGNIGAEEFVQKQQNRTKWLFGSIESISGVLSESRQSSLWACIRMKFLQGRCAI